MVLARVCWAEFVPLAFNQKPCVRLVSPVVVPVLITTMLCCSNRYVKKPYDKAGTDLKVVVRGKENNAVVTKMPFVKTTYYKG